MNDPHNTTSGATGTSWTYRYDQGGNIQSVKRYAYTTSTLGTVLQDIPYAYADTNWKDKLASYNGAALTYDAIGNPLTDTTWTYTWQAGRQLASMTNGTTTAEFDYNADGLRIRKTVGGTVTDYTLHGKNIVHLTQGSASLHFFYDAQNKPSVVDYNGTKYSYIHNLQGDIVGILNTSGTEVVQYAYDAWGRQLSKAGSMAVTLGTYNPFRYRGYMFDEETGLYYLRSRYYNPKWGRFISSDTKMICGTYIVRNVFEYGFCNPIVFIDTEGDFTTLNEIPSPETGYIPSTNGPRIVISPNGRGWLDKFKNIWVPDKSGHGGDHWDVQRGDGQGYTNVYRDGTRRPGKNKPAKLPPIPEPSMVPNNSPKPPDSPETTPSTDKKPASQIVTLPKPLPTPWPMPSMSPYKWDNSNDDSIRNALLGAVITITAIGAAYFCPPFLFAVFAF